MAQPSFAPDTVNQHVQVGPELWIGNPGQGWTMRSSTPSNSTSSSNGLSTQSALDTAKSILGFQQEANKPIVTALQGQKPAIEQKYSDLIASIKGQQQLDVNRQTLTTNNELGRRGISSDSGLYQQDLNNALLPVNVGYQGQLAGATAAQSGDLNNLALQIAQAQAGNPMESVSSALGLLSAQQGASQFAQQLALQQQQANSQGALEAAQTGYYSNLGKSLTTPTNTTPLSQLAQLFGGR